ncbi:MAG: LysR family transcriptional regulator [Saccharopolyspora sp.]|uniref:LysR family transcriptional regulator n=1 Tax=Saccharopolyspora sp. TaxID=33915 RepID=UPI0025F95E13|nr:LysR family transcriptional regulator [Saccharopolyspora sp.]MBQ6643461.1 LysR family transcriptional regulator [Saccharopolyspora sp.]
MDTRQLEYFLAVVDHGGFGRAAEALHLAQPSLSQAIAGLERELGVPLFHRVGRGVVISDAGTELVGPARQVLRDLRTARSAVDSVRGLLRGRVELATMPSPGVEPLGTLTRSLSREHPGVTVGAEAAFTPDEVVAQIRNGVCELGLIGAPEVPGPPGVQAHELESQEFFLVGAGDVEFPEGDPVSPSALAGARMIVSPPGSLMRRIVDDVLAAGVDLRIAAEVAHRTSVLPLVLQGVGLAVLPAGWVPLARRAGARIARIEHSAQLHIALVSRTAALTPTASAFLAVARGHRPADYLAQTASDSRGL